MINKLLFLGGLMGLQVQTFMNLKIGQEVELALALLPNVPAPADVQLPAITSLVLGEI